MKQEQTVLQEKEYNLLTRNLLEEGYTAENHPDYVRTCTSAWGKELWQNLAGGFEYTPDHLRKMTFRTGCGLLVKGSCFLNGSMSYMGIEWIPENDNPVIACPYRKKECGLRNPVLGGLNGRGSASVLFCDCHRTQELYTYERSMEKVRDEEEKEKRKKYDAFSEQVSGHVCHWHMKYDYRTGEWRQQFDPMVCAQFCQNVGGICSLTQQPVSGKRGNIFYDVKTSHIRQDGTLFDGEEIVSIEKGIRLFPTAKSMTICEQAEKLCQDWIRSRAEGKYRMETLLYGWKVEALNIRAEQRESRDLMQDLQDIRNGIQITHASDLEKGRRKQKKQKRQQAQENRIKRLEKKLLDVGYENLEEYSLDRIHADRWLGEERIAELEEMRRQRIKEEQQKPVQMNIFDFIN